MKAERTWLLKAERRGSEADPALTRARGSMGHALFESSGAGSLVSFGFDGLYLQTALEFRAKGGLCLERSYWSALFTFTRTETQHEPSKAWDASTWLPGVLCWGVRVAVTLARKAAP